MGESGLESGAVGFDFGDSFDDGADVFAVVDPLVELNDGLIVIIEHEYIGLIESLLKEVHTIIKPILP